MTPLQFERWSDFAVRMARTCYAASWRPSGEWILDRVDGFLSCVDDEERAAIVSWDHSDGDAMCVTDHLSEYCDDDYYHINVDSQAETRNGVWRQGLAVEQFREQWLGPVHCCLRAGLDLAAEPSAGVVGFTAGELRNMYPEGVPDWIARPGKRSESTTVQPRPLGLTILEREPNGEFRDMADATPLWL